MLVLLRLTIGWHFYSEGVDKRDAGNWSATPFFANAKGPFAGKFRNMVWDYDGKIRLDYERTEQHFANFRARLARQLEFDEAQTKQSWDAYNEARAQVEWVLDENAADLEEFEFGRQRIASLDTDAREKAIRDGVSSLGGQRETIRKEWLGKAAPALKQLNSVWDGYEQSLNALATPDQVARGGRVTLDKPRDVVVDTSVVDRIIPYFDIAIGICLLLGLFTPVAALAAAGFLGSVFLSQYPPSTGPTSSHYQLIECMACLVLASTGSGRFAGLDYFLHLFIRKSSHGADLADA